MTQSTPSNSLISIRAQGVSPESVVRAALMNLLPPEHPVHDPTRAFTMDELRQFKAAAAKR